MSGLIAPSATYDRLNEAQFRREVEQRLSEIVAGAQSPISAPAYHTETEAHLVAGINAAKGSVYVSVTANRLVGKPVNPTVGQRLVFTIIQANAGGYNITWNAVFKVTWSDVGNVLAARSSVEFVFDGTNWAQIGAQSPYV